MSDDIRDILTKVANGELTPQEAEALLDSAKARAEQPAQQPTQQPTEGPAEPADDRQPVRGLVVRGTGVRLTILADPTVATAVAEGPHRVEHSGERLIIHSDLSQGEYTTEAPRSAFMNWVSTVNRAGSALRVRVNPQLPIEVLCIAGPLDLSGVRAVAAVGVEAGSAKLSGGSGPLALSVASGSADVDWQFTGQSTVNVELGSARVVVAPGTDAVVTAEASLGSAQIRTSGGVLKASAAGGPQSVVVGDGSGRLTVSAKLGSAEVRVPVG